MLAVATVLLCAGCVTITPDTINTAFDRLDSLAARGDVEIEDPEIEIGYAMEHKGIVRIKGVKANGEVVTDYVAPTE